MKEEKRPHRSIARRRLGGVMVGCVLLVSLLCVRAKAWQAVGFVLEKQGTWQLKAGQKLTEGARVMAGGELTNPHPADGDQITVVNLNGDLLVRVRCRNNSCHSCLAKSDACDAPVLPLTGSKQTPGMLTTVLHSAMELVSGKPDRYSVHRVRRPVLSDAVVRMDDGRVDFSPVLARQESGRYKVRFAEVATESGGRTWKSDPVTVDWDMVRGGMATVKGLERGLYSLVLLESESSDGSPMDAWVLVANPDDYAKAASAFKSLSEQTAKWGTSVRPDTAQRFLRASLDYLARQPVATPAKDGKQ